MKKQQHSISPFTMPRYVHRQVQYQSKVWGNVSKLLTGTVFEKNIGGILIYHLECFCSACLKPSNHQEAPNCPYDIRMINLSLPSLSLSFKYAQIVSPSIHLSSCKLTGQSLISNLVAQCRTPKSQITFGPRHEQHVNSVHLTPVRVWLIEVAHLTKSAAT